MFRRHKWKFFSTFLILAFTTYVLLDTFVIARSYGTTETNMSLFQKEVTQKPQEMDLQLLSPPALL